MGLRTRPRTAPLEPHSNPSKTPRSLSGFRFDRVALSLSMHRYSTWGSTPRGSVWISPLLSFTMSTVCSCFSLSCRGGAFSGTMVTRLNVEDSNAFGANVETAAQPCWKVQASWADEQPATAFNHLGSRSCTRVKESRFAHLFCPPSSRLSYHWFEGARHVTAIRASTLVCRCSSPLLRLYCLHVRPGRAHPET